MDLAEDVKLSWGERDWKPERHLRINSGIEIKKPSRFDLLPELAHKAWTTVTRETPQTHLYGRYWPRSDWRPLSAEELSKVVGMTDGHMHNTVQVLRLPQSLCNPVRVHAEKCIAEGKVESRHTGALEICGSLVEPVQEPLHEWLFDKICESFGTRDGTFIRIKPSGHNSSTGFEFLGWDGLHIDHWGGNIWLQTRRDYNGSRFIFNIGEETRHLIFVNLRLSTLATRYADFIPSNIHDMLMHPACPMHGLLANAFMEACPNYPVLCVSLPPGFGYIANSTAILHDGYLVGKQKQDIAILMQHRVPGSSTSSDQSSFDYEPLRYHPAWIERCKEISSMNGG